MKPVEELYHTVLQKLIILMLGLLTLGVFMTSCSTPEHCSAYNKVETNDISAPWRLLFSEWKPPFRGLFYYPFFCKRVGGKKRNSLKADNSFPEKWLKLYYPFVCKRDSGKKRNSSKADNRVLQKSREAVLTQNSRSQGSINWNVRKCCLSRRVKQRKNYPLSCKKSNLCKVPYNIKTGNKWRVAHQPTSPDKPKTHPKQQPKPGRKFPDWRRNIDTDSSNSQEANV